MSYSRWSHSCWYTYSTVSTINDEPTLAICGESDHALSELVENKEGILNKFREMRFERYPLSYHGEGEAPKDHFKEEEILELGKYIDWFIEDHS